MPRVESVPKVLKPFLFHGVQLSFGEGEQAVGDCPFCGKEGKFSVNAETGQWLCRVCQVGTDRGGGNVSTFLKLVWQEAMEAMDKEYETLAADRKLLYPESLLFWEVAFSPMTQDWVVPGFSPDGKLWQLYRYVMDLRKKVRHLLPTPGLDHKLHGVNLWDPKKPEVYLCEGIWDAVTLWEVLRNAKGTEDGLAVTASEGSSLLASANVLAVPSASTFNESWASLFAGKVVHLMYDSDHPTVNGKSVAPPAGHRGMERVAKMLSSVKEPPLEIRCLAWGPEGFDPQRKSGFDVRDFLTEGGEANPFKELPRRVGALGRLLGMLEPIPEEWVKEGKRAAARSVGTMEPLPCKSWVEVVSAWRKAMSWRPVMEDVLSVMLATALSTEQKGDQLFLQVIGDAGSGKTRFCEALLVSKSCFSLEHLTGFHSGWKDSSGQDYSLLARINKKTLITPEGDVLMSSPKFTEIMSQQRRIFDGSSGASYKNRKEDVQYTGLRTPWIIAGTHALLDMNQARLGDRFLKVIVDPPSEDEKQSILKRVGFSALRTVIQQSNCSASSIVEDRLLLAYRLTGGYVDHLRRSSSELLSQVQVDEEEVVARCTVLAEFASFLRARPAPTVPHDRHKDKHDCKELPTRLTHQFVRLACCLAVVLGKRRLDGEVLVKVGKVAVDTARGSTMEVCSHLFQAGLKGMSNHSLSLLTGHGEDKGRILLAFLRSIGATELFRQRSKSGITNRSKWRLSPKMCQVWQEVME